MHVDHPRNDSRGGARSTLALVLAMLFAAVPARAAERAISFREDGQVLRRLSLEELVAGCDATEIRVADDPYYGTAKRYRACPLARVLALGFGDAERAADANLFLTASDGYRRTATWAGLHEPGAHLAFADAEHGAGDDPGWQPIDRRQVDPGPFYVVWTGVEQNDANRYPWPYQLVEIEIAPFAREYPHTVPTGLPDDDPAWVGFGIFRTQCIACHSINGEGGKIGPDLNVPQSIVEYRPREQIAAYIRDPSVFRYTSMPAHRDLDAQRLEGLLAYFAAMKDRKHDPGTGAGH